ncbi:MAG: uroporphyrinogen decarboxylase family protein [Oliverpabstia sp.]
MTTKERIVKALRGEKTDRIPFSPFLTYWWENADDELTNRGELEFLESIGADPLFRGHYPMYGKNGENMLLCKRIIDDCEIFTEVNGNRKVTTFHTSKGDLKFGYQYVEHGNTWFLVDHPVKEEEDFLLLKYLMDSTHLEADYEKFDLEAEKLGERGLLLPLICPEMKTSFQSLLENWVGTENMVYSVMDFPELVQETLDSMYRVSRDAAEIAANSSSEFFLSWEDTSTTNISPQYYRDYILPEINMWCDILHKKGKRYVQHACGRLNALLPDMADSKIDVLESVSPAPTGDVDLIDVNKILPEHIAIVGGIEPVKLLNGSVEEVKDKAHELLDIMKNRGYTLANSDSCPPGVSIEKFKALAQLVKGN